MARRGRIQLTRQKIWVGYNSHGTWSTFGEIRCEEVERGNNLPKQDYPPDTLAIWICLTPRKALRYVALAERWDHLNDERQPLTSEEEKMLECVAKIPFKPTDIIIYDDGDEGYLVLRPNKTTKTTLKKQVKGYAKGNVSRPVDESFEPKAAPLYPVYRLQVGPESDCHVRNYF